MRGKAVLINVVCLAAGAAVMFLLTTPAGVGAAGDAKPEAVGPGQTPPGSPLPATGQTLCYTTDGQVIDCASPEWPGQDGFYRKGYPAKGRFVDNGDGTVTDRCTGLMWQKETAPGTYNWQNALKYCEGLDLAGRTDWRLPNVRELQSIVDYGRRDPAIDPVFGAASSWYWSSSTYVYNPSYAWLVYFLCGYVALYHKTDNYSVRAVRG